MTLIVARHALRERRGRDLDEHSEKHLPLSDAGIQQARELADRLATRGWNPAAYYTSCFAHARQTAAIVREALVSAADILELCSLTPHYQGPRDFRNAGRLWTGVEIFRTLDTEAECIGKSLRQLDTIALILHKPRIEQLLAGLTAEDESRFRDLDYGCACWLRADSFEALFQGRGVEYGRVLPRS